MMHRSRSVLGGGVALLGAGMVGLLLCGCAPTGGAEITVTYVDGGQERVLTAQPDQITCEADEASALGLDSPRSSAHLRFDTSPLGESGTVWVADGALALVQADTATVTRDGNSVRMEAEGTVEVVDDWNDALAGSDAPRFDEDDVRELQGSVAVEMTCP